MKITIRRLLWILPLFLLVVFGLLSLLASVWLESSGGRQLLQNALSNSLGVPVQLAGDYDLRLFPRIRFTGSQLHLEHVTADEAFARSDEFSAVIELMPFIRKEIRIASIQFSGGYLDLPRLAASPPSDTSTDAGELELPRVQLILLKDFTVKLDEAGNQVHLVELRLEDFQPGQEAFLDFQASVLNEQGEWGRLSARSGLRIRPDDLSLSLAINDMEVALGDMTLQGLEGELDWSQQKHELRLNVQVPMDGQKASVLVEAVIEETVAGAIQLKYPHPLPVLPSTLDAQFEYEGDYLGLDPLGLVAAGQQVRGRGCVIFSEKPTLNLMLEAQELDMDEIYSLLPETEEAAAELPVELSIHLRVERAWYSGAEARQLDVLIGDTPACDRFATMHATP